MIESILLRNFQKHKKTKVVFGKGITTIVGDNDVGKSAVVRALRWACLNRPSGTAFIKDGCERVRVTVVADGVSIKRLRAPADNTYAIDGKEFRAFSSDVPEEIQHLLKVDDLNFQTQHEPAFWFHDPPGVVSKNLNAVVDLGIIDFTLKEIGTLRRKSASKLEVSSERLVASRKALKELKYIEEFSSEVTLINNARAKATSLSEDEELLAYYIKAAKDDRTVHKKASKYLAQATAIKEVGDNAIKHSAVTRSLGSLISQIKENRSAIVKIPKTETLQKAYAAWKEARAKADQIAAVYKEVVMLVEKVNTHETHLEALQKELGKVKKDSICPKCKQKLKAL